jgi:ribosomal-protein-alanine N-acetyltransferase
MPPRISPEPRRFNYDLRVPAILTFGEATSTEKSMMYLTGLNQDVHRLTAEMGYLLGEPYWGKGLVTEAATKFTEYAFEYFQLKRIYAEPFATNANSCRVLEKAGFLLESRLRSSVIKDGQILDQFLYSRIRP